MAKTTKTSYVTPADGNVFADLGFGVAESQALLEESHRVIAIKLALKSQMMGHINDWMHEKSLRQADAAPILGVTRPRVSDVAQHKLDKFSLDSLVEMVARTGKNVELSFS